MNTTTTATTATSSTSSTPTPPAPRPVGIIRIGGISAVIYRKV